MKKEILGRFLSELDHSSVETRRSREFWARLFLGLSPGTSGKTFSIPEDLSQWDRRIVLDFEQWLNDEGYAPLSSRTALGVVKRVFDAAKAVHEQERLRVNNEIREKRKEISEKRKAIDLDDPKAAAMLMSLQMEADELNTEADEVNALPGPQWDIPKRWLPRAESNTATLSLEEIRKIVTLAKSGGLGPPEIPVAVVKAAVAFVALASVYGCRRGELQAVRQEHINYREGTIFILTEKGGERSWQILCPALVPYLQEYDFRYDYSLSYVDRIFKKICDKAGVQNRDGLAWHGFRNRVLTLVRDNLAPVADEVPSNIDYALAAKIFFRWRLKTSREMEERYYTPENILAIDTFVLEHHPVVKIWEQ